MIEQADFRRVLGHLPTGVAVITGYSACGPIGMTCNSVVSVSLDPPLVGFCPANGSTTWPYIRPSGRFCINVMASHQETTARAFSTASVDRFAGVDAEDRPCGPGLLHAIAWIDCEIASEHEAGDHTIVIGRVMGLEAHSAREPLVFFRGRYGALSHGRDEHQVRNEGAAG